MKRDELLEAIDRKREEMIKIGLEKGLVCEETIHCSQELDKLLNTYQNLLVETYYSNPCKGKSSKTHSAFSFLHGFPKSVFFL